MLPFLEFNKLHFSKGCLSAFYGMFKLLMNEKGFGSEEAIENTMLNRFVGVQCLLNFIPLDFNARSIFSHYSHKEAESQIHFSTIVR